MTASSPDTGADCCEECGLLQGTDFGRGTAAGDVRGVFGGGVRQQHMQPRDVPNLPVVGALKHKVVAWCTSCTCSVPYPQLRVAIIVDTVVCVRARVHVCVCVCVLHPKPLPN